MRVRLAVLAVAVSLVACDDGIDPEPTSFRCAGGVPVGLIGLDAVTISGNPSITGEHPSVFSNTVVTLSGSVDLQGDAVSGGAVEVSGNAWPGGSIVENATPISVADPTADVLAAKTSNDNAQVPCIKKGNECTSPLSGYALSLSSQQQITLPAGTYYFESISMSGQAKLHVDGAVTIYLAGPASFSGGSATNPNEDSLTVISDSTAEVKLTGGGNTNMHIFAPFAAVRFSGAQGFHGSALGSELIVSGTADLTVTKDLAVTGDWVTCPPEPESEDDGDTDTDGPTDPPPPQPN